MGKFKDLTGQRFGRLVVTKYLGNSKWLCQCDCGNYTVVRTAVLNNGHTKSCGCLAIDSRRERKTKHGKRFTRIYNIYRIMKKRCYIKNNHKYKNYGGRGITICDEWLDKENGFMNFYNWAMQNGYSDELTIDRIDVNGNYEPNNCRWITMKEQSRNKQDSVLLTYKGITKDLTTYAEDFGLKRSVLYWRVVTAKWDIEKALTTPVKRGKNDTI